MVRIKKLLMLAITASSFALSYNQSLRADEILDWNATIRSVQATRTDSYYANPGYSTRTMAMANGAMFDIMMSFDKQYKPYYFTGPAPVSTPQNVNDIQTAAMAAAAAKILDSLYGSPLMGSSVMDDAIQAAQIHNDVITARDNKLNAISDVNARQTGKDYGEYVAQLYLDARQNDGITTPVQYVPNGAQLAGKWQPDPFWPARPSNTSGGVQQAWGPNWGQVTPFIVQSNTPFAVAAPPALGTQEYADAYDQVKKKGVEINSTRTQDETDIGIFWAYDRPTMGPPPILYSKNLEQIAKVMGNTQVENARLFTLVSLGMADAGVASWQAKFTFDYWRPVTAIQNGGNGTANDADGNAATVGDANWRPLGAPGNPMFGSSDSFTPGFPAYPSGHATFGGVTYQILRDFYGTDFLNYSLTSDEMTAGTHLVMTNTLSLADIAALHAYYDPINPNYVSDGVTAGQIAIDNKLRMFNSFTEAEYENAISRVYLGVHWIFDATEGVNLGNQIGNYAFTYYLTPVPEPSTYALIGTAIVGAVIYRRRKKKLTAVA